MNKTEQVVVIGLGEVGKPLFELLSKRHTTIGVDITPPLERIEHVDVMHICYPFAIRDFVGETARYVELFRPALTIINSTVAIGTTRAISKRTGAALVHSPVRGKHVRMFDDLCRYTKFLGAMDAGSSQRAAEHFASVGLKTKVLPSPEATELAKLTETTYFGLMIAWAQEVERYCDKAGQGYDEVVSFYEEIAFFPSVKYFPGIIGGHCVLPNIEILSDFSESTVLKAVQSSNQQKIERESTKAMRTLAGSQRDDR
jgi:UDP-N-acetyl-D-mannosaminuronate dehydrogenase